MSDDTLIMAAHAPGREPAARKNPSRGGIPGTSGQYGN
jgi:hypothetical protein